MRVQLSLGSNLGDKHRQLDKALLALDTHEHISLLSVSLRYETEPVGLEEQPLFVNQAVEIETDLIPLELLNAVKDIEQSLGREPGTRWGPRTVDIDLILYEDMVLDHPRLELPHPEFRHRNFVLQPMAEIASDWIDPVTGKTVSELAAAPDAQGHVEPIIAT